MKMTLREALEIQRKQIEHYKFNLSQLFHSRTDIAGYDLDEPMEMDEIDRRVARIVNITFTAKRRSGYEKMSE